MKIFKNFLSFTITVLITLFVIEIYFYFSEIQSRSSIEFNAKFGDFRIPNAKYFDLNEGFGLGSFNEYGYLGPSYAPENVENAFRIALIGDSYVEGFQVQDDMHFRNLTEKKLKLALGRKVEILNFGRSGFNLLNMFALDSLFVGDFNPDLTLYFLSNRDLIQKNNSQKLPMVSLDSNSNIAIDLPVEPKGYNALKYKLTNTSSIFMMVSKFKNLLNDSDFVKRKLFDKLMDSDQKKEILINKIKKIDKVQLAILEKLKQKNTIIVNRDISKLYLPDDIESLNKLDIYKLFMRNGNYDWSYHTWKVTNKIGHYNHKAHHIIADTLTNRILNYIE